MRFPRRRSPTTVRPSTSATGGSTDLRTNGLARRSRTSRRPRTRGSRAVRYATTSGSSGMVRAPRSEYYPWRPPTSARSSPPPRPGRPASHASCYGGSSDGPCRDRTAPSARLRPVRLLHPAQHDRLRRRAGRARVARARAHELAASGGRGPRASHGSLAHRRPAGRRARRPGRPSRPPSRRQHDHVARVHGARDPRDPRPRDDRGGPRPSRFSSAVPARCSRSRSRPTSTTWSVPRG